MVLNNTHTIQILAREKHLVKIGKNYQLIVCYTYMFCEIDHQSIIVNLSYVVVVVFFLITPFHRKTD